MSLRDWITRAKMRIEDFAFLARVHRSYVHMWLRGAVIPSEKVMERVKKVTKGEITAFFQLKDKKHGKKINCKSD